METSPRRDLSQARAGPDFESPKWGGGATVTLKAPCRGHEDTLASTCDRIAHRCRLREHLGGSKTEEGTEAIVERLS